MLRDVDPHLASAREALYVELALRLNPIRVLAQLDAGRRVNVGEPPVTVRALQYPTFKALDLSCATVGDAWPNPGNSAVDCAVDYVIIPRCVFVCHVFHLLFTS